MKTLSPRQPLVSVVIPAYNAECSIKETIESVVNQSYRNWELLLIDDSSSDNTIGVVENIVDPHERIRIYKTEKPSGSPSLPRNIGIENSKGKYIAFLDADDVWLPDKLEKQVEFMERNGHDVGYSFYEKMDFEGKRSDRIIKTREVTDYHNLLKSNSIPCLTSIISRKAIGDTRFKQIPQEDFCFWLDILKKGYRAFNLCEVTALYREANTSRSANKVDMFKGYWNVIRNHQHISLLPACYYMLTYTVLGVAKYIK